MRTTLYVIALCVILLAISGCTPTQVRDTVNTVIKAAIEAAAEEIKEEID